MNEVERIQQYVKNTKGNFERYKLSAYEAALLMFQAGDIPLDSVLLAYNYGRAKGYRAAKAEVKA